MQEHLSVGEFTRTMDALRDELARGFDGLNDRLDTLNGQTRRHGESIAAHDVRMDGLDREIRDLKQGSAEEKAAGVSLEGVSHKKLGAIATGVIVVMTVLQALFVAGAELIWNKTIAPMLEHVGR